MPQLENEQHEWVAQLVAKGETWTSAAEKAGYSAVNRNVLQSRGTTLKKRTEIVARVAELQGEMVVALTKDVTSSAASLEYQASTLLERFMQMVPVRGAGGKKTHTCKCGEKYETQLFRFDGKNAIAILNFKAKLAGLFVSNVNVRHGKMNEIEGTFDQIWEQVIRMVVPLGREFHELLITRLGYEVVPANLRVIEGTATDVTEASEAAS